MRKNPVYTSFLYIKDHKETFPNKIDCRLLTPINSDLDRVDKAVLDGIINSIRSKTKLIQGNNSLQIIHSFKWSRKKMRKTFLKFDMVKLSLLITQEDLNIPISFVKMFP